ncbi:MAG TPA: toll/interleukin-1 receptor domain-containing protein [Thermoanaerobaculia bacterium]
MEALHPQNHPDVFLSYSHKDREWVQDYLLKRLREEGVSVSIDSEDFEIGDPSIEAMAKAASRCRHTILVLTPDWVASPWAHFEWTVAASASPLERRVLPLLLKDCQLSAGISQLVYADFRELPRREAEFAKLLRAIAGTAPLPEPIKGEPVRRGLVALSELIQEPAVREAVVAFRIYFQRVCDRIGTLGDYKDLHDSLHELQLHGYDRIIQEARNFPADDQAVDNLREHEATLRSTIEKLRRVEEHASFPAGELSWIEKYLEPALDSLHAAVEKLEPKNLRRSLSLLNRVLTIRPSETNTRLNDAARDLPLAELIDAMGVVHDSMSSLDLDVHKVQEFGIGIKTLDHLRQTLSTLVADHDRWQEAEQELRLTEETWDGTIEGIQDSWLRIHETLEPMTVGNTELWTVPFRQEAQRLSDAIAAQNPERARRCFRSFRREVSIHFHSVDAMLKDQCDELRKAVDPLAVLLRRIEA